MEDLNSPKLQVARMATGQPAYLTQEEMKPSDRKRFVLYNGMQYEMILMLECIKEHLKEVGATPECKRAIQDLLDVT